MTDENGLIGKLNAAKGSIRKTLHRELFTRMKKIVSSASCECKEKTVFRYLRALAKVAVWPLEDSMGKASVAEILKRLGKFKMPSETVEGVCEDGVLKTQTQTHRHRHKKVRGRSRRGERFVLYAT